MNILPTDINNIILDYLFDLKYQKCLNELEKISYYCRDHGWIIFIRFFLMCLTKQIYFDMDNRLFDNKYTDPRKIYLLQKRWPSN